jgi:electron transport complex protein RnfD
MERKLTVSSPPHLYGSDTTKRIMRDVVIALLPACAFAVYAYGMKALLVLIVSVVSAVLAEFLFQKTIGRKKTDIGDLSAVITGILLALNLSPAVPLWLPMVGSVFAMIVVKQLFGGLGANFINPALSARIFLLASFPVYMTSWTFAPDAVSGATYLARLQTEADFVPQYADYMALLFNKMGGTLGEVSAVALIVGGLYLLVRKVIDWRIPFFYLATFALLIFIIGRNDFFEVHIVFEILAGGLLMGAFFMATDYATSPLSPVGRIIMGVGCGLFTVIIRLFGGYPEGVSYSILIMNIFVPIIDRYVRPRVYGKTLKAQGGK